ncbi:MAG: hypothetical protein JSS14_21855 [Proteobacteria bacterium]|nr:hypothetical protein [Pseudomonadota bacterium]
MATATTETYTYKSNGRAVIEKDPNATLDYAFNWGAYLADVTDTLIDAEFIVDPSLTIESSSFDTTTATAWISGGVAPATGPNELRVTCRITTTEGRIDDRSIFLKIIER